MDLKLHGTTFFIVLLLFTGLSIHAQTLEEQAQQKMDSLEVLIVKAEEMGISAESERMTLRTAEVYLNFANWDAANPSVNQSYFEMLSIYKDNAAELASELPDLERTNVNMILTQAMERLGLTIDSVYSRKNVPKVDFSKAKLAGPTIMQEGRPVFLLDHTWKPSTEELQAYYGALDGFYISPNNVIDETGSISPGVLSNLNNKADGKIGSIFIDHKNIPDWAYTKYDSFAVSSRLFSKYDIDHPGARELYGDLFSGTVPKMAGKNYTRLGYMLFNEPSFFTQEGVWNTAEVSFYTKEKFRTWLSQRHDSINILNELWGSSFESFDSVKITIPISGALEGSPVWYDWMLFNNYRVTDYFRYLTGEIRKYDPEARVHIKLMPWLWSGDKKDHGMDFEALTRLCDISGSDAQAKNSKMWGDPGEWTGRYSFEWLEIAMTYDFFKSVRPDHIIFDTENHFLSTTHFRDLYLSPDYARATYWLAHMHGLNAGRSWLWGRKESGEPDSRAGNGYAGTYAQQPAILNEMHETLIDLNTYAEEITSIQQQQKPLRIYYSITSAINRSTYMKDVFSAYESVYFKGIPLGFATDSIIIDSEPGEWEAILIHNTEAVTLQEFSTLQSYLDSGGTVIMDELSFKVDEYGRPHEDLEAGTGKLITAGTLTEMKNKALEVIEGKGLLPAVNVTETNSVGLPSCFWRSVKNEEGNHVLSLINLGKSDAHLIIDLPEAEHGTACRDLINGISVSPDTILKPDGVLFLEITEAEEITDPVSNISPGANDGLGASLYPNPSPGKFHLDLPGTNERLDLQIHSSNGKSIFSQSYYNTGSITHNINEHPDGFYIINIQSDEGSQNFIFAKICGP